MTVLYIIKRFEPALNMTAYRYQLGGTVNLTEGWSLVDGISARNGEVSYLYVAER